MWRNSIRTLMVFSLLFGAVWAVGYDVIGEDQTEAAIAKNRADMSNAYSILAQQAALRDGNAVREIRYDYTYTVPDWDLPTGSDSVQVVTVTDVVTVGTVTVDYDWDTDSYPGEGSFTLTSPAGTELTIGAGDTDGHYTVALTGFTGEDLAGDWAFTINDSWGDGGHAVTGCTMNVDVAATTPEVSLSSTALDFGDVPNGLDATLALTISNTGGGDLTISDLSSDEAAFTADYSSGVVPAFGSLDVVVTFSPAAESAYSGNLTITSDAASSPDTVTLAGNGAAYATSGGPDGAGYAWTNSLDAAGPEYSWIDGSDATDIGISFGDDYRGTVDLPFTFYYQGNFYTQLTVTTNAWIGMGPSTGYSSSYWTNATIPTSSLPNNIVAPLWDDFKAGNSEGSTSSYAGVITEKTVGTEPNRQYVIIFDNIVRSSSTDDGFTFQVIFDEGTNNITYQYMDVTGYSTADNGIGATIGLENADGTDGLEVSYNGSPQLIYDGIAIEFVAPEPPSTSPFFSEYIEGSSNNKALEIYNGTGGSISLDDYQIAQSVNGGGWQYFHVFPAGATLDHGETWVIVNDAAMPEMLAMADEVLPYPSVVHHNGDDARALIHIVADVREDTTWLDIIGVPDEDPGSGWDVAGVTTATANHTLMRKSDVEMGNADWAASAGTNAEDSEWIVFDQDYWYGLGYHNEDYPLPGDNCDLALEAVEGINIGAIPEIWYEYTSAVDGSMTISSDINGQTQDTRVYVYSDCEGTQIGYDDDGGVNASYTSIVTVDVLAGETYYVFWDDYWSSAMFDWELTIVEGMPDFVVSSMEYTSQETLTVVVTNQGEADSPGWFGTDYHGLFINGAYLGYIAESDIALLAGESFAYTLTGFNYDNLGSGDFEVVFVADVDDDVTESDEDNNADTLDISIDVPPATPRHLMATATPGQINLSWQPAPEESLPMEPLAYQGLTDQRSKPVESPEVTAKWQLASQDSWRETAIYGDDCTDPYIVPALPFVHDSSTAGYSNSFTYGNGNDMVYQVTIADSGYLYANTCMGISGDTKLEIYDGDCAVALDQNDDACGLRSEVMAFVGPGTYHIVVDGYSSGDVDFIVEIFYAETLVAPDLAVTEMWYDGEVVWGVVTNVGSAPETAGQSTHWYVDGVDVGYEYTDPLGVGESDTLGLGGFSYANLGPGEFYVELEADYWDNLVEANEEDNIMGITVVVETPEYVPTFNVYRDGVMIAGPIEPIDFAFNGGYVDWGLAIGDYCYEVSQILPDDTESGFSNEACATVVPGTPVGLGLMVNPDASATLNWAAPLPTGEILADDGSAERWFWVGGPSSTDHQMAQGLMSPVSDYTITHIAVYGLGDEPSAFEAVHVLGATEGGQPDMTNILATIPGVAFTATWDTGPEWVLLPVDVAGPGAEFFISVQWTEGGEVGPFVGTDDDTYTEKGYWTNDGGTTWNMFNSVFMFRAYLEVGGDLVVAEPGGSIQREVSTPENLAQIVESVYAPQMGWIPNADNRDFLGTFNVLRGTETGAYTDTLVEDLADLAFTDLPEVFDVPYYYVVTANYDEGTSPPSNEASYTPVALPWLTLDVELPFGVFLEYGDVAGADTFSLGNLGLDTLDYEVMYEVPMGRIVNRSIEGSYMYSTDLPPAAGTTTDLTVYLYNASTDTEWLDSASIAWPAGITVNTSTDFVVVDDATHYLATNGATGDGATVEWIDHNGGYGNIYGDELAMTTMNVTVDAGYTGDVYFDYHASGDIWGAEPHEVWGSFVFEIPAFTVTIDPAMGGVLPSTAVDVVASVDVLEYQDGFYPGTIHITHNDPGVADIFFPFDVFLAPALGEVAGTVTSTWDDGPIEGVTVEFEMVEGGRETFYAMTGADGSYVLPLPVGDYYVWAWHFDYHDVDGGMITIAMDATTTMDMSMDPDVAAPGNVAAYEDGGVHVSWEMPQPELVAYHNGVHGNGYFQNWGQAYGVVFDISEFGEGTVLSHLDFSHAGWGTGGLFDYNVWVIDWYDFSVIGVFEGMQTTQDVAGGAFLEEGIPLNGIATSDWVGIFIEPLSGSAGDAYPDVSIDTDATVLGVNYIIDLASIDDSYDTGAIDNLGNFIVNLWVWPGEGEPLAVQPVARESADAHFEATAREAVTGFTSYFDETEDDATRSEMLNFNIYRAVDFGEFEMIGTADPDTWEYLDTDVVPNTHYSYAISALYDIAESAMSDPAEVDFVNVDEIGLPTEFALHQNYPNPFNPITAVRYDLPAASEVRLTIYNILGQKVVTLVDEVQNAGYHSVTWTGLDAAGSPISSGIYMYRMETDGFTDVKKMMFLK